MSGDKRMILRASPLALRFALRDLAGGLRGFFVFIACIAIGVMAMSGVGAVSRSLSQGIAREGRVILGGDVSFTLPYRPLAAGERAFFEKHGRVGEIALMRAMARADSGEAALVEIKAVDDAYPSAGRLRLAPEQPLSSALASRDEVFGLVAENVLIARLDLKIGDRLSIGDARFELVAALDKEPDRLAGGVGFGARVLMSQDALRATGLVRPGSIVRWQARVALGENGAEASDAEVDRFAESAAAAFPTAGWEVRKRDAVSPQFARNQQRFAQLLTLVALTALVAGGAGVANAVDGFVARKRDSFAIMKALGAPASRVFAMALTEVLLVALLAIALGSALGACIPFLVEATLARSIDLPFVASLDLKGLALGALCGLLVTLIFSIGPLARARRVPVARLLRGEADETPFRIPRPDLLAALGAAGALLAIVLFSFADTRLTASYVGATIAAFLALRGAASLTMAAARRLPRARDVRLRHALANIHRPRSLAPALVVSMGLTQTLLVSLALVEGAIHRDFAAPRGGRTPSFYFIDAQKSQVGEFAAFLEASAPNARVEHVPMMRGRIVAVKGAPVETLRVADDVAWALEGDRGVTFSAALPAGSTLVEGPWWGAGAAGPPLVSFEARVAKGLGLSIGDEVTVNVLGREITARVANLRKVDWRSFGINFAMVFSPNAFANAPYTEMFTVAFDDMNDLRRDAALTREVARRFPTIAALRVKDALEAIDEIAGQLSLAARGAASIAILTAALALGSAIAAGQRARQRDAVVLATLGATRAWLTGSLVMEFAILATVAAVLGAGAGTAAAAFVLEALMGIDFVFLPTPVAIVTLGASAMAVALGLAGTWRTLGQRPGPALRQL